MKILCGLYSYIELSDTIFAPHHYSILHFLFHIFMANENLFWFDTLYGRLHYSEYFISIFSQYFFNILSIQLHNLEAREYK